MEDSKKYHSLHDGKWKYIMDSCYGNSNNLQVRREWGLVPGIGEAHEKMIFSGYTRDRRFIDIFNPYALYEKWNISAEHEWIVPSKTEGAVVSDERIWIDIDYEKALKENFTISITIESDKGDNILLPLIINNKCEVIPPNTHVEVNGYVSIITENT